MIVLKRKKSSTISKSKSGIRLFIKEAASHPITVGAAWPSSKQLAEDIAAAIPAKNGIVVELGAGTGVVTKALLKIGIKPKQLFVVERSHAMSQYLRKIFPKLQILEGDAQKLSELLGDKNQPVATIVSGLPLRSLPNKVVKEIGKQIEKVMTKNSHFIQFTYSLHRKPKPPTTKLRWKESKYVWRNLPPARIDIFSYDGK